MILAILVQVVVLFGVLVATGRLMGKLCLDEGIAEYTAQVGRLRSDLAELRATVAAVTARLEPKPKDTPP